MSKFSELLDEYLELRANPHVYSEWTSIADNSAAERQYHNRMQGLRDEMDAVIETQP